MVMLIFAGELIERLAPPHGILTVQLGFGGGTGADTLYMMRALPWPLCSIKTVRRGHHFE